MSRHSPKLLCLLLATLPWIAARADSDHMDHHHAANNPHMRMTAAREATPGDQARYAALVDTIRRDLERYRDVEVAKADGYREFMRGVPQRQYHFTKRSNGLASVFGFDPDKPTSLIYRKEPGGRYTLTGVMYTAPAFFSEAQLDERIPLSMAPWHEHVNLCVPGPAHRERWSETRDGRPLFGPKSPIATEEACDAVGGHFVSRFLGWMVHVQAFVRGGEPSAEQMVGGDAAG